MYLVYAIGGFNLLVVVKALVVLATAAILIVACRRNGADLGLAGLLVMLALVAARDRLELRPDVAMLFFAAGSIAALDEGRRGNPKWLVALPFVQLLWVNTHPSFPLGIALTSAYLVGAMLNRDRARRQFATTLLAVALACVVNPYGTELIRHVIAQTREASPAGVIGEWQPTRQLLLTEPNWSLRVFWVFFWLTPLVLVVRFTVESQHFGRSAIPSATGGRKSAPLQFPWSHALVIAGMSALALRANRFTGLYCIIAAPILVGALSAIQRVSWEWRPRYDRSGQEWPSYIFAPASVAAAAFLIWAVTTNRWAMTENRAAEFGVGIDTQVVPFNALDALKKLPRGGLFNTFLSGGPLIWGLYPQWRVFADGRANLYGREFVDQYRAAMRDPQKWETWMHERDVSVVFIQYGTGDDATLLRHLGASTDWALYYFDEAACIFTRGRETQLLTNVVDYARAVADRAAGANKYDWGRAAATMGNFLMTIGRDESARVLFEDAIAANPRVSEAWMNLGVLERNRGNFDRADALAAALLTRNRHYYPARILQAELLGARGDVAGAITKINQVLRCRPRSAQAWFVRAQLAARHGDRAGAIAALQRVVAERVDDPMVLWFLARLQAGGGQTADALKSYEQCLRVWTGPPEQREQVRQELEKLREKQRLQR
jgi:tetratricopeptide (TPR) repeat protein